MKRIWLFLVMVICLAFAVRTLFLIDATALWSDELYSVGKSFQSSFTSMLAMLREDTHPPAYYALLWLWGECVNRISSVWSANAPLALWSVMARRPVCSISAIVWKLPWVGSHRIPCPGVMPTIWRSVWPCRRCLWSFGWPAVDLHRPWSASSNPCSHKLCRLVTTVNKLRTTSVMRGCCVADFKPWAVPSELSGGFAAAGQQQGATGLWVHQQFEQGWRRVVF